MGIKNNNGFTLAEVLAGSAVAVVAFIALDLSLGSAYRLARSNINEMHAVNALSEEMQALRRTNYDTLVAMASPTAFSNTELAALPSGSGVFYRQSSYGADITQVTLVVSWKTNDGATATQSACSYVTRRGINGS